MKPFIYTIVLFFIWIFYTPVTHAQLNIEAYYKYLQEHSAMNANDLLQEYPAGVFAPSAPVNIENVDYFKSIDFKFKLTEFEKSLAAKNSFMVTERLKYPSYAAAYADAYIKDSPVYISSDAMLHVIHRLYDGAIADLEENYMLFRLFSSLNLMKVALRTYPLPNDSLARKAVNDADIYLTVALKLMESSIDFDTLKLNSVNVIFSEDASEVKKILSLISKEQLAQYPLFGTTPRDIDFSQMKPRSHYTMSYKLSCYYQAMVWLGHTEIYLTKPVSIKETATDEDIKRQCMMTVILANLAEKSGAKKYLSEMDTIIEKFVGEQDNLSLPKLYTVMSAVGINAPDQLRNDSVQKKFQDEALKQGAGQKILSQLLYGNSDSVNKIKPAAAFMLMGQRFLFDAFILGNVVFDKVKNRIMPSTMDAMFVLGNNSAVQLIKPEIEKYGYAKNLAGLRYLSDSFSKEYWNSSMYSTWLSGIRSLNPPLARASLPRFMQTNAWWQKTLNTQLGSWAELRHDNSLYGKSSYTGGYGCFYPAGYVEPNIELYNNISIVAKNLDSVISHIRYDSILMYSFKDMMRYITKSYTVKSYVNVIVPTCNLLASMSEKELRGEQFSDEERNLISNWAAHPPKGICTGEVLFDGIYIQMLYMASANDMTIPRYVVADVHTQPTDRAGNIVGNVLHIGTGYINTALIIAEDPADGCQTAYVGPVGSYYEYVTSNFNRLTDDEWGMKLSKLSRPAWVNSYIANDSGRTKGEGQNLFLGGISEQSNYPASQIHATSSPNPTSNSTVVSFEIPSAFSLSNPCVSVYSVNGDFINTINCTTINSTTYTGQWDGLSSLGEKVPSGVYLIHITIGKLSSVFECIVNR